MDRGRARRDFSVRVVMAVQTRRIPRHRWREALDSLSASHEGWLVRVAVTLPSGEVHTEVDDMA